jgi:hypothetical protein
MTAPVMTRTHSPGAAVASIGAPAYAGHQHTGSAVPVADGLPLARRLRGNAQHRLVQAALADRELGGVHTHRQAARAGVQVVARQCALAPLVELAPRVQRQRVCRNDGALTQQRLPA